MRVPLLYLLAVLLAWCFVSPALSQTLIFSKADGSAVTNGSNPLGDLFTTPDKYSVKLDNIPITGQHLTSDTVNFNLGHFDAATIARDLLWKLRKAAEGKYAQGKGLSANRKILIKRNKWARILFPHGSVWPTRWHWRGNRNRRRGYPSEQAEADAFEAKLAQLLEKQWRVIQTGAVPVAPGPSIAAAPSQGSILYTIERPLTVMGTRLLQVVIRDMGANAVLRGQPRFVACVSYNTGTNQGTFQDTSAARYCQPLPNRATALAMLEAADLEQRETFISKLMAVIDTSNLQRVDGAFVNKRKELMQLIREQNTKTAAVIASYKKLQTAEKLLSALPADATLLTSKATALADWGAAVRQEATAIKDVADAWAASRAEIKRAAGSRILLGRSPEDQATLQSVLTDVFVAYTKEQDRSALAPAAGTMEMAGEIDARESFDGPPKITFYPDYSRVIVEDGNVEELKIGGHLADGQPVLFETYAPIGISSDHDLNRVWARQWLWAQTQPKGFPDNLCIRLTDLLHYTANVEANGKDRSPADGTYVIHPTDGLAHRTLPRLMTTKILQARVYTDAVGISGYKPNGLIQIEVERKLEWGTPWSKFSRLIQFRGPGYFTPLVAVTKIEQTNRFLPLERESGTPLLYRVNTIDLLRYTNLRVGGDFNILGIRYAALKSDFFLDAGIYLHRVDIRDSVSRPHVTKLVRVDSTLNVAMYGFSLKTRFRPDSRYGVQSRIGFYRYALINDYDEHNKLLIQQTPTVAGLDPNAHTQLDKYRYQGVMQYELLAWASLAENSRLFFRSQFSHLLYQSNHTFFQLQLGYQFDVFTNKRDNPTKQTSLFPPPGG